MIKGAHELKHVRKPLKMLQPKFLVPKFCPSKEKPCNVVYSVGSCTNGSNIANHGWSHDHHINFDSALESWHTATTNEADNNTCPLPIFFFTLQRLQYRQLKALIFKTFMAREHFFIYSVINSYFGILYFL